MFNVDIMKMLSVDVSCYCSVIVTGSVETLQKREQSFPKKTFINNCTKSLKKTINFFI